MSPERNFQWEVPIQACRLTIDDLKRIYRLIDDKQIEDRDRLVSEVLRQGPNETVQEFEVRKARVSDACKTTITVTGTHGERITGPEETLLDSSLIPEKIATVYFDTQSRFSAFLNLPRENHARILLDFASPRFDWSAVPTAPTPNNSLYIVAATNEPWGTSLHTRLGLYLTDRKTSWNWLHQQGAYDLLLLVLGIPLALWFVTRFGARIVEGHGLPNVLAIGAYIYIFLFAMNVFRLVFIYARWAFPKVEFVYRHSSTAKHRTILAAILVGVVGGAIWDAVKAIF